MRQRMTKAELARHLGISRAYVTMLANGVRGPTQKIVNKIKELAVDNPNYNISSLTLVSSFAAFTRSSVRIA
jgi:transcriptional regulator with XRE-family HTH domain